jgi:hypothetical protein
MKIHSLRTVRLLPVVCCLLSAACLLLSGCNSTKPKHAKAGAPFDRPFPLGQVTDAHWETQQTNAEAADFIFYDHEFEGNTPRLTPAGKKHLMQVALRLEHVPFPLVVEESPNRRNTALDGQRRQALLDQLSELGLQGVDGRVVVAPAFPEGLTASEGEAAYYSNFQADFNNGGGVGRAFGGRGGSYR